MNKAFTQDDIDRKLIVFKDFIPFVGLMDDAAVISECINLAKYDIQKYKAFKERTVKPEPALAASQAAR